MIMSNKEEKKDIKKKNKEEKKDFSKYFTDKKVIDLLNK